VARFLNTSATNYFLEELIKNASERLILISPFLKFSQRLRELIEDKNRLKIDVRIVYGKSDPKISESEWLDSLDFIRTSFCENLHAKCYLSESEAIITSLNLYEFSQVNNNEMGVYFTRADDGEIFSDTYQEATRIIRISEEVKISVKRVEPQDRKPSTDQNSGAQKSQRPEDLYDKISSSRIASKFKMKTQDFLDLLESKGFLEHKDDRQHLTESGQALGGELRTGRSGFYFIWPKEMDPTTL